MTNFKRNPATMPDGAIIRPHVDPPTGLGCIDNTSTHPRWNESGSDYIYGSDWFGFMAVPSGYRAPNGDYKAIGGSSICWTSSTSASLHGWVRQIYSHAGFVGRGYGYGRVWGDGVRCVRNETYGEASDADGTTYTDDYTDGNGNKYDGVKIGEQVWLKKNLITTKYQNGNNITTGLNDAQWQATTNGAYAIYPHADVDGIASEQAMIDAYGVLYNGHAVHNGLVTGSYRVASDDDWTDLTDYLISQYDVTKDNVAMVLKSCRQVNHPLA